MVRIIVFVFLFGFSQLISAKSNDDVYSFQHSLLKSNDVNLSKNKSLVYDFWRSVFEAHHMELAGNFLTDSYIQHNPNVVSGKAGFIKAFSGRGKPVEISNVIKSPLINIIAERDFVILVFSREYIDPYISGGKYTTTWFDMFRIENGKIAEHWDPAQKK